MRQQDCRAARRQYSCFNSGRVMVLFTPTQQFRNYSRMSPQKKIELLSYSHEYAEKLYKWCAFIISLISSRTLWIAFPFAISFFSKLATSSLRPKIHVCLLVVWLTFSRQYTLTLSFHSIILVVWFLDVQVYKSRCLHTMLFMLMVKLFKLGEIFSSHSSERTPEIEHLGRLVGF